MPSARISPNVGELAQVLVQYGIQMVYCMWQMGLEAVQAVGITVFVGL